MGESKLVNAIENQILRGRILAICREVRNEGASIEVLSAALRSEGFKTDKNAVLAACDYLSGKELIRMKELRNDALGISMTIAFITPAGIDALEGTKEIVGVIFGG